MSDAWKAAFRDAVIVLALCALAGNAGADTHTWDGGWTNNLASAASNWTSDLAPSEGDIIVLDGTTNKDLIWDAAAPAGVASWTQVDYTGTVTFLTASGTNGFTNFTVSGDCVISNGLWTHATNGDASANMLRVKIGGDLVVGSGAAIDASGRSGTSAGPGTPVYRSGGSYGGEGGRSYTGDGSVGNVYGSIYSPTNLGSRGGLGYLATLGGGAIQLTVDGGITVDGRIWANAAAPASDRAGGSGGSVFLVADTLAGSGTIRAAGGNAMGGGNGSGGGGRIAVVLAGGADVGGVTFDASGGVGSGLNGAAGTVYLRMQGEAEDQGTLVVANTNTASALTLIGPPVTNTAFGNVIIRNLGLLAVAANQSIRFSGVWSNGASFVASNGSTVIVAGPAGSTSTVFGATSFQGLTCTNAGKWIVFPSTATNRVLGNLLIKGDVTSNVFLRSVDASAWKLGVAASAGQSVWYVDVENSDARAGATVTALNSISNGVNENWAFIGTGETNTWTGATNTLWSNGTNWDKGRMPSEGDAVVVPGALGLYPIFDGDRRLYRLTLSPGASLSLNGKNLEVTDTAIVGGSLVATGRENLVFRGDVDFSGSSVTPAMSALVLGGQTTQAATLAGRSFFNIRVDNTSTTVTFYGGMSAQELRGDTASGPIRVAFEAGTTNTVRDFTMEGAAERRVTLRSSSPGSAWKLNVTGHNIVRGVDVQDSDATGGLTIRPIADTIDGTGNPNWDFGAPWAVWQGTNSSSFHNPTNWVPQAVPTAASLVLVEVTNTLSITSTVSVKAMVIGGGVTTLVQATAPVTIGENLVVRSNGVVWLSQPTTVSNHVMVLGGGLLTHQADRRLALAVGRNLHVDTGGRVDATGKGYSGGPGYPVMSRCGGSHGGQGAYVGVGDGSLGAVYGSITAPTNSGSWGGKWGGGYSTAAGGALQLTVDGTAAINGSLLANASNTYASYTAGGSGGSVFLVAGAMTGSGLIQAKGGTQVSSGGGGGGRIAVWLTNSVDFGSLTYEAYGAGPSSIGAAGTIYLRAQGQAEDEGTLIVDHNLASAHTTLIGALVTNTTVGQVIIRNQGVLAVDTNLSLSFNGSWSNAATFSPAQGSTVFVVGGGTATVYRQTAFRTLACLAPGKTLRFAAGSTNTILSGLTLQGSAASNLVLRSTVDASAWRLSVSGTVVQTISRVNVRDSDASGGETVVALDSVDGGANTNWSFVSSGMTNVWTGSASTAWGAAGNWDLGHAPILYDIVRIPPAQPRYPVLDGTRTVQGLLLDNGGSLDLNGFSLTINGDAAIAGSLTAAGSETLTFKGNLTDFAGATVTPAQSAVVFEGSGAQTGNLAGCTLWGLRVRNTAAPVTLNGGCTAREFRCEEGTNPVSVRFAAGSTITTRDFVMAGSPAATNLVLRSASPGSRWNLKVTGYEVVNGTDVQDSDAATGKTVYPLNSKDSGNNINWTFGAAWGTWVGGGSSSFTNPANWSPATVPGPDTRVRVEVTNVMNIGTPVTLRAVVIGGGAVTAQVTVGAAVTVREDLTVRSNALLLANQPMVVSNDVLVLAGGTMSHAPDSRLQLTVWSNLYVDAGGAVDVSLKGYSFGPGYPATSRSGASHAGVGGFNGTGGGPVGDTYGLVMTPTNPGSLGGKAAGGLALAGGGAIQLDVGGRTTLEGNLLADGGSAGLASFTSGGSGGSVFLTTGTLEGSGTIRANGGQGNVSGSGGGGRLAVIVRNSNTVDRVTFRVHGGVGGSANGGAGTIYLQTSDQDSGRGTVLIENNNQTSGGQTHMPPMLFTMEDEVERAMVIVSNRASVLSSTNTIIGNLLIYTNSFWTLTNCTVSVRKLEHSLEDVTKRGPGATNRVDHYTQILWIGSPPGTLFVVR